MGAGHAARRKPRQLALCEGEELSTVFASVSVAGLPPVEFCLDPERDDPVAQWLLDQGQIDEPVQQAFAALIKKGDRVVDLGANLGVFSLAASLLGAEVIAVDGSAVYTELLAEAATRNGFDELQVVKGAITDDDGAVAFVERGIHGHLLLPEDDEDPVLVPAVKVDKLVQARGWDGVDVVKMDVEGLEPAALRGMERLFDSGARPVIVTEVNGGMLPRYGSSIHELRGLLVDLGYRLLMLEPSRPGVAVEMTADAVQSACVADYVAFVGDVPAQLRSVCTIESSPTREGTVARLLIEAASPGVGYRIYAAELLHGGPAWLREDPVVAPAARALAADLSEEVRRVFRAPADARVVELPQLPPPSDGRPADVLVWIDELALRSPHHRPELPYAREDGDSDEMILRDVSLHIRRGEAIGLLAEDGLAGLELLRAIAGFESPAAGTVDVAGAPLLLPPLHQLVELDLSVADNVSIVSAFVGGPPASEERIAHVLGVAGIVEPPDTPLGEASASTAVRLALAAGLDRPVTPLVLLDRMPETGDDAFRQRMIAQTWAIRARGGAVVQHFAGVAELVIDPSRTLLLAERTLLAAGHPDSVFDLQRRRGSGLASTRAARREPWAEWLR